MHEVCKSDTKGESIIYKEWTRFDNKEQGTLEAKQQNTLTSEECFIKKQRMLQLSKRKLKVKTCAKSSTNNYENGGLP
jgi:hypothetical protein